MRLIAGLHLDDGRIDQAESIATELNSQYRDLPRKAGLWALLGRLALAKSEYSAARDAYQRLLEEARDSRNASSLFSAHTGLGLAHEGMGDWAGAAQYYQEAVAHTEELRSILPQDESEAFFDVRIEGFYRTAPYEGLSRVLLRLGRPRDAFGSSEYTRARVFAESISRRVEGVGLGIPPEVLEKDEEINDRLAALRKQRQDAYEKGDKEAVRAVEYQVKELERSLAAHRAMLRDKYPLYAATRYPQPMELSQTALKQDEWVLSYDVTDPGFIVYLTRCSSRYQEKSWTGSFARSGGLWKYAAATTWEKSSHRLILTRASTSLTCSSKRSWRSCRTGFRYG
jgi:tetratricopeptide (TPR) repeat protein